MPADSLTAADPVASDFSGATLSRTGKRLFHATRPKFFPASVLPVVAGTAWGVQAAGHFELVVCLLALLATLCVHAGSNVLNDVGDESNGTDRRNDQRVYPYTGGSRFIQNGIMDSQSMARLGVALLIIAALAGLVLIAIRGPLVLLFGLLGISLGVLYSLGPARLSSLGIGETAVAVAFGVLPVTGAAWLQGAGIAADLLLFSLPVSAWVAAILLINEVPDVDADAASGKRTLPVRLGLVGTSRLYMALQIAAAAVTVLMVTRGSLPLLAPLLPVGLLVLAQRASAAIRTGVSDRSEITKGIEATLGIHTLGTLWLTACALYLFWSPGS